MTKVPVYNETVEKISDLDLNPKIFGLAKIDPGLVHLAITAQRSNARGPAAHTKNRGEVAGSGKKPWKQKGTGRARAGSVRSPLWRGGGITFGPTNQRAFSLKLNCSALKKAVFNVFTDKIQENKLVVLDSFTPVSKTKELAGKLDAISGKIGLGKKRLLVTAYPEKELLKAARNLKNFTLLTANQLNVIDLLTHDILITKEALPIIEKTYAQ